MSFATSFIPFASSVNPSLAWSAWSLGNGWKGYIIIEFPFALDSGWYQKQPCRAFRTFQHRKERKKPLSVQHEFIVLKLVNGWVCRIERVGDPNARLNALVPQGSLAQDLAQCFESEEQAGLATSDIICEVTLPCEFDILDVLKICRAIKEGIKTRSYTLQVYNCYFFALAIQACLTRLIAHWEDKKRLETWISQVGEAISELTGVDQKLSGSGSSPHYHVLFKIFAVLSPYGGRDATLIGDMKSKLQQLTASSSIFQQDVEYHVNSVLWYSTIDSSLNKFIEEKVKEAVLGTLQERLPTTPTSKSGSLKPLESSNNRLGFALTEHPTSQQRPHGLKLKLVSQPRQPATDSDLNLTEEPIAELSYAPTGTRSTAPTGSTLVSWPRHRRYQMIGHMPDSVELFLRVLHIALLGVLGIALFTFELDKIPCIDIEHKLDSLVAELECADTKTSPDMGAIIQELHELTTNQHGIWNKHPWDVIRGYIKDYTHTQGNILQHLEESKPTIAVQYNNMEVDSGVSISSFQSHLLERIQMQAKEVESYWLGSAEEIQKELLETLSQVWKTIREDASITQKALLGDVNELAKAINYAHRAVDSTPHDHPELPKRLNNLGTLYCDRFQRLGMLSDCEEAIKYGTHALTVAPNGHPDLPKLLGSLGVSHSNRFRRLGESNDLDKALEYMARAVSLTPYGHPDLPDQLSNLGASYRDRFQRWEELGDLEQAIEHNSRALALTPDGHSDLPIRLSHLGTSYSDRFKRLGDLDDLEKAIGCMSRVVALTPDGHPNFPKWLYSLGEYYSDRFQRLGEVLDLEQAVNNAYKAVVLTPEGHPSLPAEHYLMARLRFFQYRVMGSDSYLEDARQSFHRASKSSAGSPRTKFKIALDWTRFASNNDSLNPIEAYATTMDLLPQYIWLGSTIKQRYDELSGMTDLAINAASAAIRSLQHLFALEWLENARCVVWNQILRLGSPLDELHSNHPALASRLEAVAKRLHDYDFESRQSPSRSSVPMSLEEVGREHRRLTMEYEDLLSEARTIPGFEHFLRPMKANFLARAAQDGPIVVIHCDTGGCNALLILPQQGDVDHIPLPGFTLEKAQHSRLEIEVFVRSRGLRERRVARRSEPERKDNFGDVLEALWYDVVKPVLDYLGYTNRNDSNKDLPHITWCPTGAMTLLPLHAAGNYDQPGSRIFDHVISSYTPTLTALMARRPVSFGRNSRVLAIAQQDTPGHSSLPGTVQELEYIRAHIGNIAEYTQLVDDQATTAAVLDAMEQHDWVHFACHAHQNVGDATKSGFFLHDGLLDLAAINRRSFKSNGLVFLSACQTATGDEMLSDEAIRLASGMLMAGFPGVIATMWSVVDADAPFIADKVYAQLVEDSEHGRVNVGKILHNAVAELRERVGEREFRRWVPFIYIGS